MLTGLTSRTGLRRALRGTTFERVCGLAVLAILLLLRFWDPAPVEVLRLKTFDFYQWLKPKESNFRHVVIVDIDEQSLAEYGQWPWPRTLIADLVSKIAQAGAAVVGFDAVFPEADRMSPRSVASSLRGVGPDVTAALRALPSNDAVLAATMKRTRVILGQSGVGREKAGQLDGLRRPPVAEIGEDPKRFLLGFPGIVRNIPELERAATGLGIFTILPERDGIVRRVPAVVRVGDVLFPTLAMEILRVATGQSTFAIRSDLAGVLSVKVQRVVMPTDRNGRLWLHFAASEPTRYVPARDVLSGSAGPERLAGKLVLVGTSAVGLLDIKATPLQSAMPGVEIHAQLLENILANHHLVRPNDAFGIEFLATAIIGLLLIMALPKLGAVRSLIAGIVAMAALGGGAWYAYAEQLRLYDATYPATATLLVYAVLAYLNYVREESGRREVRGAFSRYLSPALVEQVAEHPEALKLGGETRDLTLLFCDIRGFTTISESLTAEELTGLINRFLTPMTEIILDNRGTIDKYIGDCIMAFWNAPLDDPDHAADGCRAALRMIEDLGSLNETWSATAESQGKAHIPISIGIGINTGSCSVGNMGSEQRFDYSVLGDSVNLASRLEGQTKSYGVDIIIGEQTRRATPDLAAIELDLIRVKGKAQPVHIYALLGDADLAASEEFRALADLNRRLLEAYRSQRWSEAESLAAACVDADPTDSLTSFYGIYKERIGGYTAAPPEADWDGVYVATQK